MARPKKYGRFELTEREIEGLTTITNTRMAEAQKVQRAKILLLSAAGMSNVLIAEKQDINRNSVALCLKKYASAGMESANRRNPRVLIGGEQHSMDSRVLSNGHGRTRWTEMLPLTY